MLLSRLEKLSFATFVTIFVAEKNLAVNATYRLLLLLWSRENFCLVSKSDRLVLSIFVGETAFSRKICSGFGGGPVVWYPVPLTVYVWKLVAREYATYGCPCVHRMMWCYMHEARDTPPPPATLKKRRLSLNGTILLCFLFFFFFFLILVLFCLIWLGLACLPSTSDRYSRKTWRRLLSRPWKRGTWRRTWPSACMGGMWRRTNTSWRRRLWTKLRYIYNVWYSYSCMKVYFKYTRIDLLFWFHVCNSTAVNLVCLVTFVRYRCCCKRKIFTAVYLCFGVWYIQFGYHAQLRIFFFSY